MNSIIDVEAWHRTYRDLTSDTKAAIDAAFDAAAFSLRRDGITCLSNDPAEVLIAAITAYVYAGFACDGE